MGIPDGETEIFFSARHRASSSKFHCARGRIFFHLSQSFNGYIECHSAEGEILRVPCALPVQVSLVSSTRNDGAAPVDDK
jgi:hypothetical protein